MNVDGTLTGPITPPWEIGRESTATACAEAEDPPPAPAPPTEEVAPAGEQDPVEALLKDSPPWLPFALGGVVTLIITAVGLVMQVKRN